MKIKEETVMIAVIILLVAAVSVLYVKSNIFNKQDVFMPGYAAAVSGKGECYTSWQGADCLPGFTKIKSGKLTVVTDPAPQQSSCACEAFGNCSAYCIANCTAEDGVIYVTFANDSSVGNIYYYDNSNSIPCDAHLYEGTSSNGIDWWWCPDPTDDFPFPFLHMYGYGFPYNCSCNVTKTSWCTLDVDCTPIGELIDVGAGEPICANIPDKAVIETWGLEVEQSSFDCAICCKI